MLSQGPENHVKKVKVDSAEVSFDSGVSYDFQTCLFFFGKCVHVVFFHMGLFHVFFHRFCHDVISYVLPFIF